jgi:hypothetical protein
MIRELKDENTHLRDEMANLRKSFKSKQSDKKQQVHTSIIYSNERTFSTDQSHLSVDFVRKVDAVRYPSRDIKVPKIAHIPRRIREFTGFWNFNISRRKHSVELKLPGYLTYK